MSGGGATLPGLENASTTEKSGWLYSPEARKLYMGTKQDPGPVRYALESSKQHAKMMQGVEGNDPNAWAKFLGVPEGSSGADISAALSRATNWGTPAQTAAHGGVMNLDGFAKGGKPKPTPKPKVKVLTPDQKAFVKQMAKKETLTPAQEARLAKIERMTGIDVSPKESAGTRPPGDPKVSTAVSTINTNYATAADTAAKSAEIEAVREKEGLTPAGAMMEKTAFFNRKKADALDPYGNVIDPYGGVTNPILKAALDVAMGMKTPEEFSQATGIYGAAAEGLIENAQSSWADTGTADKYMNPYLRQVMDIQKREANLQYDQQLQKLRAQAAGQGAFGGSRHAILEAEAARNQQQLLNDIEAKGMSDAYTSGMDAYTREKQLAQSGYTGAAGAASGLTGTGTARTTAEAAIADMLARGGAGVQDLAQSDEARRTAAAQNLYGGVAAASGAGLSALTGSAVGGTRDTVTTRQAKGGIVYAKR
jgi:hypothetical protein